MSEWFWSYLLVGVGLAGFVLAGQKVWWCWYVNFFCQFLWLFYAVVTQQWGFIVGAIVYMIVFGRNAYKWTEDRRRNKRIMPARINPVMEEPPNVDDYPEGQVIYAQPDGKWAVGEVLHETALAEIKKGRHVADDHRG